MQYIIGLLAAVGIAIIALVGTNGTAHTTSIQSSVSNAIANASALAQSIQSDYGSTGTFASLTDQIAVTDGDVPTNMVSGTAIVNGWGGAVTVQPDPGNAAEFDQVWTLVPQAECGHFAAGVASAVSASINGGTTLTQPIDPGEAGQSCQSGSNSVTLVFNAQG